MRLVLRWLAVAIAVPLEIVAGIITGRAER